MTAPMTEGGQWLAPSYGQTPTYVVGQDTITRLARSGWVIVDDPREEVVSEPQIIEIPAAALPTPKKAPAAAESEIAHE